MKFIIRLATLTLAVALAAVGQMKTTTLADKLEKTVIPAKGTMEVDVRRLASVNKELDTIIEQLDQQLKNAQRGSQPPSDKDKELLLRLLEKHKGQGLSYYGLNSEFASHAVVFFKKLRVFLTETTMDVSPSEREALFQKYDELVAWEEQLRKSIPKRDTKNDAALLQEAVAYLNKK